MSKLRKPVVAYNVREVRYEVWRSLPTDYRPYLIQDPAVLRAYDDAIAQGKSPLDAFEAALWVELDVVFKEKQAGGQ